MPILRENKKIKLLIFLAFFLLLIFTPLCAEEDSLEVPANPKNFRKKGRISGRVRSYYMNRTYVAQNPQQSTALGMWLNYRSPAWNKTCFVVTGYTSQPVLTNNPQYGGANLLSSNQQGFSVLGRIFLDVSLGKNNMRLYRQTIETPFINTDDFRMVPYTVEAYTIDGTPSQRLYYMLSQVNKIKGWNNTAFQWMSDFAGFLGTNKTVTLGGIKYNPSDTWKLQLWHYLSYDFMSSTFFQSDADWYASRDVQLAFSTQAVNQQSIGNSISGNFHTGMLGLRGGITWKGISGTLAYNSTSLGHDIVNPWGSYQGFSSLIEEDCDLAGERAWTTGLAYNFEKMGIRGLSAFYNHSHSYLFNSGNADQPLQDEYDITVDYAMNESAKIRFRLARVLRGFDMGNTNFSDCRLMFNYDF